MNLKQAMETRARVRKAPAGDWRIVIALPTGEVATLTVGDWTTAMRTADKTISMLIYRVYSRAMTAEEEKKKGGDCE